MKHTKYFGAIHGNSQLNPASPSTAKLLVKINDFFNLKLYYKALITTSKHVNRTDYMNSIIKLGQYVRHHRQAKGNTQLELSLKIFNKPNQEYIGRLERGTAAGITFATADKIMMALDSELEFCKYQNQ